MLGDRAAVAAVRRNVRNHRVFQLDAEVRNGLAVAVGAHKLEYGPGDRLAGRAGLEEDR